MSCRVLVVTETGLHSGDLLTQGLALVCVVRPREALETLKRENVQVVLMEVGDQLHDPLRAVERIMAEHPVPILVVAAAAHRARAIPLLAAGALDALEWPSSLSPAFLTELRRQLVLLSKVRVVQHPRGHRRRSSSRLIQMHVDFPLVAIAASMGGPRALADLLADLPDNFGAPVVICQHITPGFSLDLARWLSSESGLRVHEASDGQRLLKGEVFVAPADQHLVVQPTGLLRCENSPPVGGFKPSCDVLLSSAAASFGARSIGVVLTGMGRDGAAGLAEIRKRGGRTIAQDEASCAMFGMPREAIALGAAQMVLSLGDIADQLMRWVS